MYVSVCLSHFSHVQLFVTLWIIARQPLLFMGFSRQEFWSGLPFPSPGEEALQSGKAIPLQGGKVQQSTFPNTSSDTSPK